MFNSHPTPRLKSLRPGQFALRVLVSSLALGASLEVRANAEKEELLKLKNTTLNLIDMLVEQGVLNKDKAASMVKRAEKKAEDEAKAESESHATEAPAAAALAPAPVVMKNVEGATGAAAGAAATGAGVAAAAGAKGPVRVTYVPDFVKDQIRADVEKQLKDEVVKQVKADAKNEKWGIPASLPDWVSRIKPFGDIRLRFEDDFYGSNNVANSYLNYPLINAKGGILNTPNPYMNTNEDRDRFRVRLRFGAEAKIVEGLKANFRVTTSNDYSPTSTNQTLGNYNQGYIVQLDRAYLQYDFLDDEGHDWFSLWGGRTPNPYFSTDNLYYTDVNLEGFSGTFRAPFGDRNDPELRGYNAPNTAGRLWFTNLNQGFTKPNEVYLTTGFYPLQETPFNAQSKWMGAAQTGFDWLIEGESRLKTGVGYYDYHNTQAQLNPPGSTQYDWRAPQYFTFGNSLAQISNDQDPSTEPRLVGLASRFQILDVMTQYDYTGFAPNHIMLTGNYSKNLGFNQTQIMNTLGMNISPQTNAYQVRMDLGRPDMLSFGDWNTWVAYKYLERDSVMDAFTDSNFHLGGTNAKGYEIGVNYGLANNVWANLRWLSSSLISPVITPSTIGSKSTAPYNVDVLLVDVNARF